MFGGGRGGRGVGMVLVGGFDGGQRRLARGLEVVSESANEDAEGEKTYLGVLLRFVVVLIRRLVWPMDSPAVSVMSQGRTMHAVEQDVTSLLFGVLP
jgi:hypothetical protein